MFDYRRALGIGGIERGQLFRVWLPAGCAVALTAALFWSLCFRRPDINFFADDPPARWIVYPTVPNLRTNRDGPLRSVFRRKFMLEQPADQAQLNIRAFKDFTVSLNGVKIATSEPSRSWKAQSTVSVRGDLLSSGQNELVATVSSDRGPPALWLVLDLGRDAITSDNQWQASILGALPQPARLAASAIVFGKGTAPAIAERPLTAMAGQWPIVLGFTALAVVTIAGLHRLAQSPAATKRSLHILLIVLAAVWLFISISNWRCLHFLIGYDCQSHLEYIDYVRKNRALPLGNEGLEMWQPPLYYLLASALTAVAAAPTNSELAVLVLRALAFVVAFSQLLLVAGCLRLVYRDRALPQCVGIFIAGCLPVQLYLLHYASNDVLAAALSTATVFAALRMIQQREARVRDAAVLGVCLGAAIVSKLTAWPVAVVVLLVLFWQLVAERRGARQWLNRLAVPVAICALVCGWYFVRNGLNFGQLLPPDQAGFRYWQDPGYVTAGQFARFGHTFSEPFFSTFAGVPDGVYSTLWGDGGWGGCVVRAERPPWNYNLMAAGYLLALTPTLLIVVGGGAVLWQVLRGWKPEKLLLLGTFVASCGGVLYFYLHHPIYGAIKAHYLLPSIASLCVFAAEGYMVLARDHAWRRFVVATALGAWGLTALATFVVNPSSTETQSWIARRLAVEGNPRRAFAQIGEAIRDRPDDARLRATAGHLLVLAGRIDEARIELTAAVQADPNDAEAQRMLAHVLGSLGRQIDELTLLENLLELAPDDPDAYIELAIASLGRGDDEAAVAAARSGLRVTPAEPLLHLVIATASARLGDIPEAIEHYQIVLEWEPDNASALSGLASIQPMHPDGVGDR